MTHPMFRLATPDDAPTLAGFAERMFRDTFGPFCTPADLDAYCSETYGAAIQRAEIADPERHVLVAHAGGELVAFAQLRAGLRFPCVTGTAPIELLRFYVDPRWHGRGLAARMMEMLLDEAAARGARTVYLAVFEHNLRARAFYAKYGFVAVGSTPFPLGTIVQTDLVLARAVDDARRSAG